MSSDDTPFSRRHGYRAAVSEIIIREDAPDDLRYTVLALAQDLNLGPSTMRDVVCKLLMRRPDPNNWSEFPNVDQEVHDLVDDCDWYYVYDIAEAIARKMEEAPFSYEPGKFANELNDYFIANGIGWKLVGTLIEARGPKRWNLLSQPHRKA